MFIIFLKPNSMLSVIFFVFFIFFFFSLFYLSERLLLYNFSIKQTQLRWDLGKVFFSSSEKWVGRSKQKNLSITTNFLFNYFFMLIYSSFVMNPWKKFLKPPLHVRHVLEKGHVLGLCTCTAVWNIAIHPPPKLSCLRVLNTANDFYNVSHASL